MSTYNLELQEIQSAYFGHECFSIFTACCYHCPTNKELVNENITVTSERSDHPGIASHTCIIKVMFNCSPMKCTFSFGATIMLHNAGHVVLNLIAWMDKRVKVERCYSKSYHGKGSMNGTGNTIKTKVFHLASP